MILTKLLLALGIGMVICFNLLVWFSRQKRYLWGLFFIPMTVFLAASIYLTIESVKGYATSEEIQGKFQLHWYLIDEPKNIYIWATKKGDDGPRAHWMPYNKETHKKLSKRSGALKTRGLIVIGDKKKPSTGVSNPNGQDDPYTFQQMRPVDIVEKVR